ncbi:MAG TPA: type III secretion system stator protein SctL [Terriglobales bacterium]|nr:type III secretion system stator protein SctL [Terriglobales bacterium]
MDKIIKAAAEPKLVKKEAYAAVLDAVTILDTAREQARSIVRDAEARADAIREEARRQGEDEGLRRHLQAIVATQAKAEQLYASAEDELIRLATGIARKIVGAELRAAPETIVQIVREALAAGRQGREIVVRVHPSAVAHVRAALSHEIHVKGAESVDPGGCVVESEFGVVDAQLETQLRVIERALLSAGASQ